MKERKVERRKHRHALAEQESIVGAPPEVEIERVV
jgi:hypothetical protein